MFTLRVSAEKQLEFSSARALEAFAASEYEFWNQAELLDLDSPRRLSFGLLSKVKDLVQNPDNIAFIDEINGILRSLENDILNCSYVLSTTSFAKFLKEEAQKDHQFASRLFALNKPGQSTPSDTSGLEAFITLVEFRRGLSKASAAASRLSLSNLQKDYTVKLSQFSTQGENLLADFEKEVACRHDRANHSAKSIRGVLDGLRRRVLRERDDLAKHFEKELKGHLDASADKLRESDDRILAFEENIKTAISLKAPITYWDEKRIRHLWGAVITGMAFVVYIWLAGREFIVYLIGPQQTPEAFLEKWRGSGAAGVGMLFGIVALGLIFARVIYRLFASELHLWNDAAERVTVVKTYLALAERGHAKEEFLAGLMNRLFMPASDGFIKDDFGSVGPLEAISRQLSGKN